MFKPTQRIIFSVAGFLLLTLFTSQAMSAPMLDFRDLVKRAAPAVVNISTERTTKVRSTHPGFEMFRGDPNFERFFDNFDGFSSSPRLQKQTSLGSGFIISSDGYIVTNNHVIEGADTIRVNIGQKNKDDLHIAEVVGTDPETDLALLKIKGEGLPTLSFGNSDVLEVGEWVVTIGSPLGLDHTVTAGILSAKGRNIKSGPFDDFLQTDAAINEGNSGGPLLNMAGEVVGINTAISRRAQGIGFAIPSSLAQRVINDLKEHKKVNRGWLGVTIQNVDGATAKSLGMRAASGALVSSVLDGQPASIAGIKSGDVIVAINDSAIVDTEQLLRTVALLTPGSKATVTLWRDSKEEKIILTVAERGSQQVLGDKGKNADAAAKTLGMNVRPITADDVRRYRLTDAAGLFVAEVDGEGLAAEVGIQPGDVILAVNKQKITSVAELAEQVENSSKETGALLLHISRNGSIFFCAIEIGKK